MMTMAPPKAPERKRVSLDLSEETLDRVEQLREKMQRNSPSSVSISQAMALRQAMQTGLEVELGKEKRR